MIERILKLFIGGVLLVAILKYPWWVVNGLQAVTDCIVRTADALVHLKLSGGTTGKG